MRGPKLRSGVNIQAVLKQKGIKQGLEYVTSTSDTSIIWKRILSVILGNCTIVFRMYFKLVQTKPSAVTLSLFYVYYHWAMKILLLYHKNNMAIPQDMSSQFMSYHI
jgi:hypothetical protein